MGVLYLLGLGVAADVETAMAYFEKAGNDANAYNAIGVIYQQAPDVFEQDPAKLYSWGQLRQDKNKARAYLEKSAEAGHLNARYNLGVLSLDEKSDKFSYGQAYDHFKLSAVKGHTLSAYNLAVMNFLGVGTFKSCTVSKTFFKHVNAVGEQTQTFKKAFHLVQRGYHTQAAFLYMELAE